MNRTKLTLVRHLHAVAHGKGLQGGSDDAPFEEVLYFVVQLVRALGLAAPEPAAGGIVSGAVAINAVVDGRRFENDMMKLAVLATSFVCRGITEESATV